MLALSLQSITGCLKLREPVHGIILLLPLATCLQQTLHFSASATLCDKSALVGKFVSSAFRVGCWKQVQSFTH